VNSLSVYVMHVRTTKKGEEVKLNNSITYESKKKILYDTF
jgi:hypothetical protein